MKNHLSCLLIDDDTDDRDFFNRTLRNMDEDIVLLYSPSGEDAIKNLKNGTYKPNYIFLDLNMFPMSGLECLGKIKKIARCTDTPVIIYSAIISEDIKYNTLKLGAFDHFEKPWGQEELEAYLTKIMQVK